MREYEAYHIHSHLTNILVPDSVVSKKDYAKRFKEIGNMHTLSTCEHGWQGDIYRAMDICDDMTKNGYNIRPVQVTEAYFVKDRTEKDNTNAHLIIAAVNNDGRKRLNMMLSEANIDGFYYRPRIDMSQLLACDPSQFIITTACIAGVWKYREGMEWLSIIRELKEHFGKNFFLEVQPHNTDSQKALNETILNLYQKGYQIIAGTDSHFVEEGADQHRTYYLESKGIFYEEEQGWDLSLPTGDELFERFMKQGVLSAAQAEEAIKNTLVFRNCNNPALGTQYLITKDKKIPNIYKDMTVEERIRYCKELMFKAYNDMYPNATKEEKARDFAELRHEVKVLECEIGENQTIADYFLVLKEIIERGQQKGGILTKSGRGSAPSFLTNHLLSLTSVNRITAPVHMYADRFISEDRIAAGALPDFDANVAEQEPFVEAGREMLGEWGILPMIAFGKLQVASAWKMYARANSVPVDIANEVSKSIQLYEKALRHAKEESDNEEDEENNWGVDLARYVPEQYMDMVAASKDYMGVIDNYSPHACAHLLIEGDIREEIGVIRLKGSKGATQVAAIIDGETADKYGYLKIDLLIVQVVKVINEAFEKIGVKTPTAKELLAMTADDKKTWDMYAKGYTMGLNQVEQPATSKRVMQYKPKNIVELSAFVAAVRPGFKSLLDTFLSRKDFKYHIPSLDELLITEEMPYSFMIFQEQIMKVLQVAGISASESYNCIKAISKKNRDKIDSYHDEFIRGFVEYMIDNGTEETDAKESAKDIWLIILDNAQYGFNSSHAYCVALDSLYGAWLKAHHPYEFYLTLLENYVAKGDKNRIGLLKNEMFEAYGIRIVPPRFRMDNRTYVADKENKQITDALSSAKNIGKGTAEALYSLANGKYDTFVDLLAVIEETPGINKTHMNILIKLGYFEEFGKRENLAAVYEEFKTGKNKYSKGYVDKTKEKRLEHLRAYEESIEAEPFDPVELISFEVEILGSPSSMFSGSKSVYAVTDVNDKYTPKVTLANLNTERTGEMKIKKALFQTTPLKEGDIVVIDRWRNSKPFITKDGFVIPPAMWIDEYRVFSKGGQYSKEELNKILGVG